MSVVVDYKVLKANIIKCCNANRPGGISFNISFDKLTSVSDDIGLVPVRVGMKSKKVRQEDIPFISEYFTKQRLEWFQKDREMTVATFFYKENLDEEALGYIDIINAEDVDVPDEDKVHLMAELVAKYPCYFATIVSYQNLDPKRIGKPSYFIICRANKIAIRDQRYEYNPQDMS